MVISIILPDASIVVGALPGSTDRDDLDLIAGNTGLALPGSFAVRAQ